MSQQGLRPTEHDVNDPDLTLVLREISQRISPEAYEAVVSVVKVVRGYDRLIDETLPSALLCLMCLDSDDTATVVDTVVQLAGVSEFAPVFYLQKLPLLRTYGLLRQLSAFATKAASFSSRGIAYLFGSDQLKTVGLSDILVSVGEIYYKELLTQVNELHDEFGPMAPIIMRSAEAIKKCVIISELPGFMKVVQSLHSAFGPKITGAFVSSINSEILMFDQCELLTRLLRLVSISEEYTCLSLRSGTFNYISSAPLTLSPEDDCEPETLRQISIEALRLGSANDLLAEPRVFRDPQIAALHEHWNSFAPWGQANILDQLQRSLSSKAIINDEVKQLLAQETGVLTSLWFSQVLILPGVGVLDEAYIRGEIRSFLKGVDGKSTSVLNVLRRRRELFDRNDPNYSSDRLKAILLALSDVDTTQAGYLKDLYAFVSGRQEPLRSRLSKSGLIFQSWKRDPWTDYGRSDELFSCTSIGDYNGVQAPAILGDPTISSLDVWSAGRRVGRLRFSLAIDLRGCPRLILDCLDGSERIVERERRPSLIIDAALRYAKALGFEHLKINIDVEFNPTPKKFIRYLTSKLGGGCEREYMRRALPIQITTASLPHPLVSFLETFGQSEGALVRGPVVSTGEDARRAIEGSP